MNPGDWIMAAGLVGGGVVWAIKVVSSLTRLVTAVEQIPDSIKAAVAAHERDYHGNRE